MKPSFAVILLSCLAAGLPAVAPPPPRARPLLDDAHDLIVLHPSRPYRVRLHLQVGRRSFRADWAGQMARLFDYLDSDGDGVLSKAEAGCAPSHEQWLQMTGAVWHLDPGPAPDFAVLSGGKKTVQPEQLSAYYANSSVGPLQVSWSWRPRGADRLGDALWRLLDTNRDGKLSRAELQAAPRALARLDLNEDEMISQGEVMGLPTGYSEAPSLVGRGGLHEPAKGDLPFFSFSPDGPAGPLVRALLTRYDRDRNSKLSATEIGLPAGLFRRLDANGDGQLDMAELARWPKEPADVELIVPLEGAPRRPVEVIGRTTLPLHATKGGLTVVLGDWAIDVRPTDARGAFPPQVPAPTDVKKLFRSLDTDGDGYLGSKEIYRPPFTYVSWLRLADRDGDGRLSEKEFTAFSVLRQRLGGAATFLRVEDEGNSLFRLLDVDRDGRLGPREVRSAWQRLSRWDRDGKGALTKTMLPHHYRVTVQHGQPMPEPGPYFTPPPRPLPARGPLWFRKMDRNGDGDVSLGEWLGTRKQFDEIDTDRDGLISPAEAEAYDRRQRPGKKNE